MKMESGKGWKWYGYAGHLCVGKRCAFHLQTSYKKHLVSTVGAYYPKNSDIMETIGAEGDDFKPFFETFVYPYSGDDANGDPVLGDGPIDSIRYEKSIDAERGHYAMCNKWLKGRKSHDT